MQTDPDSSNPSDVVLSVEQLEKTFGNDSAPVRVLEDVTFDVKSGEFICVVGPSGSGKTTLLKLLGGLSHSTSGQIVFEGKPVSGPPEKMAFVFQDYSRSLLPWMTVGENIMLPMRRRYSASERKQRAEDSLAAVGLAGKSALYPWQMSGGMQQRVAIARGLAYQPDVLLMDEPFAAVDAQTRIELEDLVLRLQRDFNMTVLFVTHDIDEAIYLADRVIVLSGAPTKVTENLTIDLPRDRDQISTKGLPRYVELRSHVFELIQNARSHASIN